MYHSLDFLFGRQKPEKLTKIDKQTNRKLYEYYICDQCAQEIKLTGKKEEREGGLCKIPATLTKRGEITVALHNRCLNNVIKEIEREAQKINGK